MKKFLKMILDWIQREPATKDEDPLKDWDKNVLKSRKIIDRLPVNSATKAFDRSEAVQRWEAMDLCNMIIQGSIEDLSRKGTRTLVDYAMTARCRISELEIALKKADARVKELEAVRHPHIPGVRILGQGAARVRQEQREDILAAFLAKYNAQPEEVEQIEVQTENGSSWLVRMKAPVPGGVLDTADRRRGDRILAELHAVWSAAKMICHKDQLLKMDELIGREHGEFSRAMGTADTLDAIECVVEAWQSGGVKNALEMASVRVAEIAGIIKAFREAAARLPNSKKAIADAKALKESLGQNCGT